MTDDRLPTELWVAALIRQCATAAIPVYVVHKGAPAAGTVMVKIITKDKTCKVLNQSRDLDGKMGWMDIFDGAQADEKKADEYIQRSIRRDPDVWVVEVEDAEDAEGKNPFEGAVF